MRQLVTDDFHEWGETDVPRLIAGNVRPWNLCSSVNKFQGSRSRTKRCLRCQKKVYEWGWSSMAAMNASLIAETESAKSRFPSLVYLSEQEWDWDIQSTSFSVTEGVWGAGCLKGFLKEYVHTNQESTLTAFAGDEGYDRALITGMSRNNSRINWEDWLLYTLGIKYFKYFSAYQ